MEKREFANADHAAKKEISARAEFLRCLCQELQEKNAAILAAEAAAEKEQMGDCLRRAGEAARAQKELLEMLENVVRCL